MVYRVLSTIFNLFVFFYYCRRMLWEHNSTIVVMLTKLKEMGRVSGDITSLNEPIPKAQRPNLIT